jgi:membrane protease subunit HflK
MQWDNRNKGGWDRGGPPDLMDLVSKAKNRFGGAGKGGRYPLVVAIVVILAIILVYTAVYRISPGHRGVVLRFGKYSHTAMPGINLKIPFGVDTVTKVHTAEEDSEPFAPAFGRSMKRGLSWSGNPSCSRAI